MLTFLNVIGGVLIFIIGFSFGVAIGIIFGEDEDDGQEDEWV